MTLVLAAMLAGQTVARMHDARRVLIVAAPRADDARLARQDSALAAAERALADRDVTIVTIADRSVHGASDDAEALRRRWRLPAGAFGVVLVGKDGHEALRRADPIAADTLIAAIDAMPMRRAGLR